MYKVITSLFLTVFSASLFAQDCIAVIPAGSGHQFWQDIGRGAQAAGKEFGYQIFFRGPADESSSAAQRSVIDLAVSKEKCVGLVLAPNNADLRVQVEQLKAAGIPTVFIDRDTGGAPIISVVSTNNYEAGKLAATKMAEAIGSSGKVAVLRLKKGVPSTDAREMGFIDQATAMGLTVSIDQYIGTSIGEIRKTVSGLAPQFTDEIKGVFTPNESTTMGFQLASGRLTFSGVHIGFDSSDAIEELIGKGNIYGVIVQQPYDIGYNGVKIIVDHLNNKAVPEKMDSSVKFLMKTDL